MKNKKRRLLIGLSIIVVLLVFVFPFGISAMIYEANFGDRYTTYEPMARNLKEFEGLNSQRYTFSSNEDQTLVGYKYYRNSEDVKGVVIIAHGLGGGGHNSYIDIADYFTLNDYLVFAYDATGNDESEGSSVKGIPQGLIDLEYALQFVNQTEDFKSLPIFLFGHSWGGYSAGSALNDYPEVKAVVMIAGFNQSMDIIEEEGRKIAGNKIGVFLPYISLYEKMKFGKFAAYNCIDGFEHSEAGVMVVHSQDDEMISEAKGFNIFYERYQDNPRFRFLKFKDRGHEGVYRSEQSLAYKEQFDHRFDEYVESLGYFTPSIKEVYLKDNLDKKQLFELDKELMDDIVGFYDEYL